MSAFTKFLNAACIVSIFLCIAISAVEKDYSETIGWCVAMMWLSRCLYSEHILDDRSKSFK